MAVKIISWIPPETSAAGFNYTKVERSTDAGAHWVEFTALNEPTYAANGLAIAVSSCRDLLGDSTYLYRIRFYNSVSGTYSEYSESMYGDDVRGYCYVSDIRDMSNIQITEYDDNAIQLLIDAVSARIDTDMGRTWRGVVAVTDEYLDSDGFDTLDLPKADIVTLSAISIDTDNSGTFTTLTPSTDVLLYPAGYIALKSSSPVTRFPSGRQRVKVSYTYGNAEPTDEVRQLCRLDVVNLLKFDTSRAIAASLIRRSLRRMKAITV